MMFPSFFDCSKILNLNKKCCDSIPSVDKKCRKVVFGVN